MSEFDYKGALDYYKKWLKDAKTDEVKVAWHNPYSQELAFYELLTVSKKLSGEKIVDIGCGIGALFKFLKERGIKVDYTGYDINPNAIEEAKKLHPDGKFFVRDILTTKDKEQFDYVFISGTLNYLIPDHDEFVFKMIARSFELCRKALSFNMLSSYALGTDIGYQWDKEFYYASPEEVFTFCKGLTPLVSLNHDTQKSAFFVFMYRDYSRVCEFVNEETNDPKEIEKIVSWYYRNNLYHRIVDLVSKKTDITAETANFYGLCLIGLNKFSEAKEAFENACRLDPKYPFAYINAGHVALRESKVDEAAAWFKKALDAKPSSNDVIEPVINCYFQAGMNKEAKDYIDKLTEEVSRGYFEAIYFMRTGDFARVVEISREVVKKRPSFAYAYSIMGEAYRKLNQPAEAYKSFKKVLKIMRHFWPAQEGAVRSLIAMEDYSKAILEMEQMRENDFTLTAHGFCLYQMGRLVDAKPYFKKARRLNPYNTEAEKYLKLIREGLKE